MFLSTGEERAAMEGVFWYGLGIVTGMAALPWVQRLAARVRRMLAELELVDPVTPRTTLDDERHPF
jgi:hypothetical protein